MRTSNLTTDHIFLYIIVRPIETFVTLQYANCSGDGVQLYLTVKYIFHNVEKWELQEAKSWLNGGCVKHSG